MVKDLHGQMNCICKGSDFDKEIVKLWNKVLVKLVPMIVNPVFIINFGYENYPN